MSLKNFTTIIVLQLGFLLLGNHSGIAQNNLDTTKNFVVTRVPREPVTSLSGVKNSSLSPLESQTAVRYIDGYGRADREVLVGAQPDGSQDITVNYSVFDDFFRPQKKYLDIPTNTTGGQFVSPATLKSSNFYSDTAFYSKSEFEYLQSARPTFQLGPGENWHQNNKASTVSYSTADILKIEMIGTDIVGSGTLRVRVTEKTNEEGQRIREYKDNQGRVLRKEIELTSNDFSVTVFVYDDYNRLVAVIQPKFFVQHTGNFTISPNTEAFTESVFYYNYDYRGRLLAKHIPGYLATSGTYQTGYEEYVYDKNDRIVFSRNTRQAEQNLWSFTLYDIFGRETMSGEKALSGETRVSLQGKMDAHTGNTYETRNSTGPLYYTTQSIPSSITTLTASDIQSVQYYDAYDDINTGLSFTGRAGFPTNQITDVKGMAVGGKSKNSETSNWIQQVTYFDETLNAIQTRKAETYDNTHGIIENHDVWMSYSFLHEVLKTDHKYIWRANSSASQDSTITSEAYVYDHMSRPLKYYHGVNEEPHLIAEYLYDDIGRLSSKKLYDSTGGPGASNLIRTTAPSQNQHTDQVPEYIIYEAPINGELVITPADVNSYVEGVIGPSSGGGGLIQTVDFTYHIRGGIKSIAGDLFSENLNYEESGGFYDGNIKQQTWEVDGVQRTYTYDYDLSGRLLSAVFSGGNTGIGENYSMASLSSPMTYDKNGNILSFSRKGVTSGSIASPSGYGDIDDLTYLYTGNYSNKLLKVTDAVTANMTGRGDFENPNGGSNDYSYYNDGSLKTDANKGITAITYNRFNLTKQVVISSNTVDYLYNGNGLKIKKKTSAGTETIYEGALILEKVSGNFEVYQIAHTEGRYSASLGYEYAYTDHLGSTRLMYHAENGEATITQQNDYDPWGLELKGIGVEPSSPNHFKYTGKETQEEIAWMDFGARMFDAQLGRWFVVDAMAEKYHHESVYGYVFNNPINFLDPDGNEGEKDDDQRPNETKTRSYYHDGYTWWENHGGLGIQGGITITTNGESSNQGTNDVQNNSGDSSGPGGGCGGLDQPPCNYDQDTYIPGQEFLAADILETYSIFGGLKTVGGWIARLDRILAKRIIAWKAAKGVINYSHVLNSASSAYKGSTVLGHALSKHSGRNPSIWGKLAGNPSTWHNQALKHFDDIMNAPGGFVKTPTQQGINFIEKRLPDGRGIRLNMDQTFKGFID